MTSAQTHAWVDESQSHDDRDPGTYFLAAAIARVEMEADLRDTLTRLRLPRRAKLHWRDENDLRRTQITQVLAGSSLQHLVVVRAGRTQDRIERRRRKCFERLVFELAQRGVEAVTAESRGPADDRRDIEMLNAMRGQRQVDPAVRLEHVVGRKEPMLWIPDAVCGLVRSARTGDARHLEMLGAKITVLEV